MPASDTLISKTRAVAAITVDRTAGITLGMDRLPSALGLLRGRQLALAEALSADRWAGPSRCHRWTAHEVIRTSATRAVCT